MLVEQVSMTKYVAYYCVAYVLLAATTGAILIYFDIDMNSPGFIIVLASTAVAVFKFHKDHVRPLSKQEIWVATWGSWAASIFLDAVAVSGVTAWFVASGEFTFTDLLLALDELPLSKGVMAAILLFVAILFLGVTRLGYGLFNKSFQRKLMHEQNAGN